MRLRKRRNKRRLYAKQRILPQLYDKERPPGDAPYCILGVRRTVCLLCRSENRLRLWFFSFWIAPPFVADHLYFSVARSEEKGKYFKMIGA